VVSVGREEQGAARPRFITGPGRSWRPRGGTPVKVPRPWTFPRARAREGHPPTAFTDIAAKPGLPCPSGPSRDTAAFAVNALRLWWQAEGAGPLPPGGAAACWSTCDAGGFQRLPVPALERPARRPGGGRPGWRSRSATSRPATSKVEQDRAPGCSATSTPHLEGTAPHDGGKEPPVAGIAATTHLPRA